ncbi:toxin HicA [Paenarthrobacter sp. NPDC058040]|uniref:toxin HicA n=1 Tax=unclassified Paenarthrobacter TaxID=2634190 RepID=UPI0036DE4F8A
MVRVEDIEAAARNSPKNMTFADLAKLARKYFGEPRNSGSSHYVFKTPWPGDPRVNIQDDHGKAKPYQVRQVIQAIDRLREAEEADDDDDN